MCCVPMHTCVCICVPIHTCIYMCVSVYTLIYIHEIQYIKERNAPQDVLYVIQISTSTVRFIKSSHSVYSLPSEQPEFT